MFFSEEIFTFLNIEPESSYYACVYLLPLIPGQFFNVLFMTSMRYLQATGEFNIGTKLCVVSLVLHTFALVLLFLFGIASLTSIAIVASLTMVGNFIVLMYFWNKLNREQNIIMLPIYEGAFSDLTIYLKLGIPSAILTMSEFVIFEIMTLMAAYLGAVQLATISVVVNILSIGYETTGGLSTALTSLIGRLLGEEKPN